MSIQTISKSKLNIIPIEESYAIALGFPSQQVLSEGMPVKLSATGELEVIAGDGTERPLGIVTRGTETHVYAGEAVVITDFKAVINAKAEGTVVAGTPAIFHAQDSTDGLQYKTGPSTSIAIGMFLSGGADGEDVQVGIFKTPYTVA